jgi:deoxyadenosine/deoxycytidine kinase
MSHPVIALVGAPGTGKTYLAERIAASTDVTYIAEPPLVERIVENFAAGVNDLESQLYFLEQGVKNIHQAHELAKEKPVLMDTYWQSTLLYVAETLEPFARNVVTSFISHIEDKLPLPDKIIWLTAPSEHIIRQVKDRSREFEITDAYLSRIIDLEFAHRSHFYDMDCITIDKSEYDFVDDNALDTLLRQLELV